MDIRKPSLFITFNSECQKYQKCCWNETVQGGKTTCVKMLPHQNYTLFSLHNFI